MEETACVLKLRHLVFDDCTFIREGFKTDAEVKIELRFNFEDINEEDFIARVEVTGKKENEYHFLVRAAGYFNLKGDVKSRDILIRQNATAIVFPYVRSQISLLTAQPEVDPVVLPPFNIAKMVEDAINRGELVDNK